MSYTEMSMEDLLAVLRTHCKEVAEIAHVLNKSMVLIVNGRGPESTFNLIDMDPIEEVLEG